VNPNKNNSSNARVFGLEDAQSEKPGKRQIGNGRANSQANLISG